MFSFNTLSSAVLELLPMYGGKEVLDYLKSKIAAAKGCNLDCTAVRLRDKP
jgi:hypothetical protein